MLLIVVDSATSLRSDNLGKGDGRVSGEIWGARSETNTSATPEPLSLATSISAFSSWRMDMYSVTYLVHASEALAKRGPTTSGFSTPTKATMRFVISSFPTQM